MNPVVLSQTSQELLSVMFENDARRFYVNELIRLTGKYPNSIHKSLISLEKQGFVKSYRIGNRKLHCINEDHKLLQEVKGIVRKQGLLKSEDLEGEWIKLVNRKVSLAFQYEVGISNKENLKQQIGSPIENYWYNNITSGVYYERKEVIALGNLISEKVKKDPNFANFIVNECKKKATKIVEFSEKIPKIDLKGTSNKRLALILRDFRALYRGLLIFLVIPHSVERVILGEIEDTLRKTLANLGRLEDLEQTLEKLVAPVEDYANERNDILKIAASVKRFGLGKRAQKSIADHAEKYKWLSLFNLEEEPLSYDYFREEVENILKKVKNPTQEIEKGRRLISQRRRQIQTIFKKLHLAREVKDKVEILQAYIYLRTYRKNAISKAHYYHLPLLNEIAGRMRFTPSEIKHLTYEEMLEFLEKGQTVSRAVVRDRIQSWAVICLKGKSRIITGAKEIVEIMERHKIVSPIPLSQKVLRGRVASRGVVTGRVKVVRKPSEVGKVAEGDVLVAKMTTPDYMMAVGKASAIVTDEGGVTSHAAIVSREFNIPCIVGTRNATSLLKDNDLVEVNAEEGIVRIIEQRTFAQEIKEIYGKPAYKGKVKGVVRIVLDASDFPKVKEGDILVAPQTTPEHLSSLYKVGGFVVDEDSITSHAVLYAQALRIPSLIATEIARFVLKDGDLVEVDAEKGIVRRV